MLKLFSAVFKLISSLLPFLEIVFISFFVSYPLQSSAVPIIVFIVLFIGTFFWLSLSLSVGWGLLGFLLFYVDLNAGWITGILMALVFAAVRFLLWKGMGWIKKR
ncbi:hypothetical protein [Lihuaxuella thermophila]|uniref:Uncharacterized protein n=1 Tax=Lihuaxuella thermophila TaxID=1173111 RepID=A0A1H8HIW6_9BACL|nr:hypothetical protein [Lihuaxuella thermophila]SEN55468.1 hypothetical protein SAMN05444955_11429 [Lihuaxuella thermophila]